MNTIRTIIAVTAISTFAMGAMAFSRAGGIDCSRAGDNVESAICAEPGLRRLDGELAAAYRAAMQRIPQGRKAELLFSQRRFIEDRTSCSRVDCIYEHTLHRMFELERWR